MGNIRFIVVENADGALQDFVTPLFTDSMKKNRDLYYFWIDVSNALRALELAVNREIEVNAD